jgi:hypothetical protein
MALPLVWKFDVDLFPEQERSSLNRVDRWGGNLPSLKSGIILCMSLTN